MPIAVESVTDDQVAVLLNTEESHFVDLKAIEVSPASVSKNVSAFANASGGEMFIGIDEGIEVIGQERVWRGFADQEAANGLIQTLDGMSPLGNHYILEFLRHEGLPGLIAHITVFKSKDILLASNGKIYVRRGAQKLPVESDEAIRRLRLDKGVVSFEDETTDLDPAILSNSVPTIDFMLNVVPHAEPEEWLVKQRLVVNGRTIVAGVLLFSEEPQAILPKRSAVKIFRYKTQAEGERDTLAFDPITIEGPALRCHLLIRGTLQKIVEDLQRLGAEGLEKVIYPEEALHEIITNAVLHRDYSIAADVQVRTFDNRIEIESPRIFPGHITVANVLKEQFARNPKTVRLINKFPDAPNKDVGEGLNTAFEAMEKLRLKQPTIQERSNSVLVTLRHEGLGSPEQLVMDYMEHHPEITNPLARELTGFTF